MKNIKQNQKEKHMSDSVRFDEFTHTYYLGDKVIPSVTQILQEVFPDKYKGVPKDVLQKKAEYGTQVHKFIEIIETKKPKRPLAYIKRYYKPDIYQIESIKQYLEIKKQKGISVLESEKKVVYKDLYAGTLDMVAKVNDKLTIVDIKTTSILDKEYVSWQTSLYEKAYKSVEELYVLWLPKGHLGKLEKVERIDNELLEAVI